MIKDILKLIAAFIVITVIPSALFSLAIETANEYMRNLYIGFAVAIMYGVVMLIVDGYHNL